jgi:hypothetical protein
VSTGLWAFVRAIRGPIILVLFGTLVSLNQLDVIEFWRTWPILIIVYGLLLLLDKMLRPPAPTWPGQRHVPQGGPQ